MRRLPSGEERVGARPRELWVMHIMLDGRPGSMDILDAAVEITDRWRPSSVVCAKHETYVNVSEYPTYYGMGFTVRGHVELTDHIRLRLRLLDTHPGDRCDPKDLVTPYSKRYDSIDALLRHGRGHLSTLTTIARNHALWTRNYFDPKAMDAWGEPCEPFAELIRGRILDHYDLIVNETSYWSIPT